MEPIENISENILNKDIFNEHELKKLSPDYKPLHSLLRMQMRRNLTKDTHNHGVLKNNNWQRKSFKRPSDNFKINREIIKIRNSFQNINLKNEIMLKCVETSRTKIYENNDDVLLNTYKTVEGNNVDLYLHEVSDELIVHNDSEFKINYKPKVDKVVREKRVDRRINKRPGSEFGCIISPKLEEEIMKIECKYKSQSPKHYGKNKENETKEYTMDSTKRDDEHEDLQNKVCIPGNSLDGHDLQTLLVMMAISPKTNQIKDPDEISSHEQNDDVPICDNFTYNWEQRMHYNSNLEDDITDVLSIRPMKVHICDRQTAIMKKYTEKWKEYVAKRKEYVIQQRQEVLNHFFDKLSKKKLSLTPEPSERAKYIARDCGTYQHRYKVQKHIIALQKAKLEEQNRLIEELKYNKIVEASRQSVDAMREEVRKSYYEIDRQLKPKIKCLTNELKIPEIEEQSLVLHCLKVPQFLQRMEKRARKREEKHAMIRERRRQMEEERIRLKQQAELARVEMDKEEKQKRIKELKEKRKREKIDSIRKKQYAERLRALIVMADLHYEKYLMSKYGISPFRQLVEIKRDNMEKARAHYKFQLKKNLFLNWMWHTEDMWFERNFKAEDFNRKRILRKSFEGIKQNHHNLVLKKQVADDYYDFFVTKLVFRKFRQGIETQKKELELKWQKVVVYHNSNLLFKVFTCWRTLPALNALKREQEARKARWREKVLQVVPDYAPPED